MAADGYDVIKIACADVSILPARDAALCRFTGDDNGNITIK